MSRRYWKVVHSDDSQQTAMDGDASGKGLSVSGQFPWRFSDCFQGDLGHGGISVLGLVGWIIGSVDVVIVDVDNVDTVDDTAMVWLDDV